LISCTVAWFFCTYPNATERCGAWSLLSNPEAGSWTRNLILPRCSLTQLRILEVLPKTQLAMMRVVENHGVERRYGRLLPGRLRAHGLAEVGAEARIFMWQGGSAGASLMRANFQQLRADMIQAGYITEAEVEQDLARLKGFDFLTLSPIMWAAWGRRPQA